MSLLQSYRELHEKRKAVLDAAQSAFDDGNQELFRSNMDEAKRMGVELDQMKSDLEEMDKHATMYQPANVAPVPYIHDAVPAVGEPAKADQLTREELEAMKNDPAAIVAAHKAGRLDNIMRGVY